MPPHALLNKLWTKSPRDYWQRFVNREHKQYRPWLHGKQRNWGRLAFHLGLSKAFSARAGHPLHFDGASVLEVGSGQVLGLLPLALLEGATSAAGVDPDYREIRDDAGFCDDYLFPMFTLYQSLNGSSSSGGDAQRTGSFGDFLRRIAEIRIETDAIEKIRPQGRPFDIVLSKSCLEHIADIPAAARSLHALAAPGSVHAHYIDFTLHYAANHRQGNRFGATYEQPRSACPEYLPNPGGHINLLRASDIVKAFQACFAEVHFFPTLDYTGRLNLSNLHADWRQYDAADLSVANGMLIAVK